jgi:glycosyltransferase involved in cell wall biosynthesis
LLCLDNQYLQHQPLHEKALELRLDCERVPCRGRLDLATVEALRRVLLRHPHALLHVHDYKSALLAWLARGRRRQPIIATAHGQFSSNASLLLYHQLEVMLMRGFERVCVVSGEMRPWLVRAGVQPARICVIENGIDTLRFSPSVAPLSRTRLGIPAGGPVFGAAMRLTAQKNPLGLIDAFALVVRERPAALLLVAGDGPLRNSMQERAQLLSIQARVRFLGQLNELERFYPLLDAFVLPSLYEGLPLALLEAMAAQCRVVATSVGQVPTVLEGLPSAILCTPDTASLCDAMLAASAGSVDAAPARERVVARYSVARMARDYAQVYRDVWNGHERLAA